jgi:ATP-binding cassette subfamily B protein
VKRFLPYFRPYGFLLAADLSMALLGAVCIVLIPLLTRRLFDFDPGDLRPFAVTLCALAAVVAGMMAGTYLNVRLGQRLGARIEADMRRDLFAHIQRLSFGFFDRTKTGHLMSRITNDLSVVSGFVHALPEDLFISSVTLFGAFGVMFWMNAELALVALLPLPVIVVCGTRSKARFQRHIREMREEIAEINSTVENAVQGIREVQSFAGEAFQQQRFDRSNRRFCSAKEKMADCLARFTAVMTGLIRCHGVLVAAVGSVFCVTGRLDMPDLLAFVMYARFMMLPIDRFINLTEQYAQGLVALDRFSEIYDSVPEIRSAPDAVVPGTVRGEIRFERVTFRYPGVSEAALDDVSMTVAAGETVALVGESGAGKSTLARLLPRFYEVAGGAVLIDGADVRKIDLACLRRRIGIVQQTPFLFDSTLRENIALGRVGATETEILEAARQANILAFIQSLPDGIDARIGEHGVKLSGGQKQRIAIARVFLKDPPILVFDEATSALDNESEHWVQESMKRLCAGRTTLIIAHRLSTVKHASRIFVMRSGRVIESGTHAELLDARGYYSRLYRRALF